MEKEIGGSSRISKLRELVRGIFGRKEICDDDDDDNDAYVLLKNEAERRIHEVVPLSLGIEIGNGVMRVIVPRNTRIPTRIEKTFTTRRDSQRAVSFSVYEGERVLVAHNNLLGRIVVDGIPDMKAGLAKIKVCFEVDADGILTVSAAEKKTGMGDEMRISICNEKMSLSKEEIDRMVAEARRFRSEDKAAMEKVAATERLQRYLDNMKGTAEGIIKAVQDVEEWLDKDDYVGAKELEAKLEQLRLKFEPLNI